MASDWQLALEQESDLSVASGSATAVAEAVRAGAELRVYLTTPTYEETLYFQQTYAGEGDALINHVACPATGGASQRTL